MSNTKIWILDQKQNQWNSQLMNNTPADHRNTISSDKHWNVNFIQQFHFYKFPGDMPGLYDSWSFRSKWQICLLGMVVNSKYWISITLLSRETIKNDFFQPFRISHTNNKTILSSQPTKRFRDELESFRLKLCSANKIYWFQIGDYKLKWQFYNSYFTLDRLSFWTIIERLETVHTIYNTFIEN